MISPSLLTRLSALWRGSLCAALLALLSCGTLSHAHANSQNAEYKVKAAFLYNFVKFVRWPDASFGTEQAVNICILGQDPFGDSIAFIEDKHVGGRALRIIRDLTPTDTHFCHLLFISHSEQPQAEALIARLQERPVLSVGDMPGFARQGGIINFTMIQGRVKLEINAAAARKAGLNIDPALLEVAHKVFNR